MLERSQGYSGVLLVFAIASSALVATLPLGCDSAKPGKKEQGSPTLTVTAADVAKQQKAAQLPLPAPSLAPVSAVPVSAWSGQGCTQSACHEGIEPIVALESKMMRQIKRRSQVVGDADGCVLCHGGTLDAESAELAHQGAPSQFVSKKFKGPLEFYPDPSSPWINEHTCGLCHRAQVSAQWSSLMMTEAGKIQGTAWGFGSLEGYEHKWGNYDYENPHDPKLRLGTDAYRAYMKKKAAANPQVHVERHQRLPAAPGKDDLGNLTEHPEQAAFTYLRAECQRCHLGVKGRQQRGDFRGMGCGACHVPYSNEGFYEGRDAAISKDEPGHALVHSLQGTRGSKVTVHDTTYSGVPVETCSTCHNRGKRIGVSYQGLMESAYGSPYTEGGGGQLSVHSKHYVSMQQDIHYQKGMLCQDCHTSGDVHGDRFLAAANLAAVEIECTDCHGTPRAYPWELPLGYGDEDAPGSARGKPRGVSKVLPSHLKKQRGLSAAPEGYVLSARGNPMPDVERKGDAVVVHSASGKDLQLQPLKKLLLEGKLSREAHTAMVQVDRHVETMECYSCHSSWAPQCYGCHIKVDYSDQKSSFDWVMAGQLHARPEHASARGESHFEDVMIPGEVQETRSYLRWEDPVLGNNGEGRVSPLIPGCQTSVTVIGKDGRTLAKNRIFRSQAGSEGAKDEGQLGSDMSPTHPHTVGKSRSCESCHASDKALGYGIGGLAPANKKRVVDLESAEGKILSRRARTQIEAVEGLIDWSAVVTRDGKQLQTVGHHLKGSGPLSAEQREKMDRQGTCAGCHSELPDGDLAVSALHHAAEMMGKVPKSATQHSQLLHKILRIAAWAQVAVLPLSLLLALLTGAGLAWWFRRPKA